MEAPEKEEERDYWWRNRGKEGRYRTVSILLSFSFSRGVICLKCTGLDSKEKEGLISLYPSDFDWITWPSLYMHNS